MFSTNFLFYIKNYINDSDIILKIIFILVLCLPVSMLSGPALPDIIISLSGILFIINLLLKKINIKLNNFYLFFFIFCFYIVIRSIFSEFPYLSLESSLFYFRFGIFSIATYSVLQKYDKFIDYFFYILLITFIFLIIDGFYQYIFKINLLGYEYDGVRLTSIFKDEPILGSYISRLLPLLVGLMIFCKKENNFYKFMCFFVIFLSSLLIFISGERTSILILFISFVLIIILIKNLRYVSFFSLLLLAFSFSILIMSNSSLKERVINLTIYQISGLNDYGAEFESEDKVFPIIFLENFKILSMYHESIYYTSLAIFKDNPIFGVGTKLFRYKCSEPKYLIKHGCSTHSHNYYIQLLAETGLVGFLFLFSIFLIISSIILMNIFQKHNLLNDPSLSILICFFINLFPFLPSGNFFHNWLCIVMFIPLPFYFFIKEK